jgi:hypothetical protein
VLIGGSSGRQNFCGQLVWEKEKPSFLNANLGGVTEYVLAYAGIARRRRVRRGRTARQDVSLNNANPLPCCRFGGACDSGTARRHSRLTCRKGKIITRLLDPGNPRQDQRQAVPLEGGGACLAKLDAVVAAGPIVVKPFRPTFGKAANRN